MMSQVGHRCREDVPQCQGDFVMYLVGHGCLADILQSQGDFTMESTVELYGMWWDMGVLKTSHSPKGRLGWEGSGTVMFLVGHGSLEDIPQSPWDFGMGRTVGL